MVSADGLRIVVVDFKFGADRPEYQQQVLGYMRLLQQMSPQAQVEGYLWFVYSGRVEHVGEKSSPSPRNSRKSDSGQLTLDF